MLALNTVYTASHWRSIIVINCEIVGKNVDLQTTNAWILRGAGSRQLIYDFLLVINTNLPPILHHFQDTDFDRSKIAIFGYPSCV